MLPVGVLGLAALCALPAFGALAAGQEPAALVEQIDAQGVGLEFMDFVDAGTEITLAPGETLTLSYFQSCVIEEIAGGRVVVGERESSVADGGTVSRSQVDCDGGGIVATERQSQKVAALVTRGENEVGVVVYSTEPLFVFRSPVRRLHIEVKDPAFQYEEYDFTVTGNRFDLADERLQLRPGTTYWVSAGDEKKLIEIDRDATGEDRAAIGRLVTF